MIGTSRKWLLAACLFAASSNLLADTYVPPRSEWERRTPESMGFDEALFASAGLVVKGGYNDVRVSLLIVLRWVPAVEDVVEVVLASLKKPE